MMEMLNSLVLLLAAAIAAGLLYRGAERVAEQQRGHLLVLSLASGFIALSGLAELLLDSTGQDSQTLKRLLTNLADYAALPLIGSALLALARGWQWSQAAWGRWLLVLFALFELFRRAELGNDYSAALVLVVAACWLLGSLLLGAARQPLLLLGALLAAATLVLLSPHSPLAATGLPQLYGLGLAVALLLLASQLPATLQASTGKAS
ncbi:hypothetical protein [Marinobacterium arenosum]|uniref:hypothetical protein n=1 Tax=Marinobacterium arenosum TaxID=2862496 RepID=UPI001C93E16A|nr:hypothetical protein [Marinobacterium arenosum]MBY4678301.1 hypothetical protein [Marinobacterium arenosum]